MIPEYDRLADIYDVWVQSGPAAEPCRRFYVDMCRTLRDPVVELGIGTGRIAIEIARLGVPITGIDVSPAMTALCQKKFEEAGLQHQLSLLISDVRHFELPEPAPLIIFPYQSIGYLPAYEDKLALLHCVRRNLKPGGRFIFDHYILDKTRAHALHGIPQLTRRTPEQGATSPWIWTVFHFDFSKQLIDCSVIIDEVDDASTLLRRTYRSLSFSWIEPDQVQDLLRQANLKVQTAYGDFNGSPLTPTSEQQIWVAERPIE